MFSSDKWFGAEAGFYPETINQSLRFEDGDSPRLSKTFGSGGNRKTWTWSAWVKRGNISSTQMLFHTFAQGGFGIEGFITFQADDTLTFQFDYNGGSHLRLRPNRVFRDTTNFFHICCVADTSNSTQDDRLRMYINGVRETSFSLENYPTNTTTDGSLNSAYNHYISGRTNNTVFFDGYLAEVNFLDGVAVTDTSGVLDELIEIKNGVCIPKNYSGSYGTTGFRFTFADSSSLGDDTSGLSTPNDFASSGLASTDVVIDSPTNNFPTLNRIGNDSGVTFSEGNLKASVGSGDTKRCEGTFAVSSGKWYFEVNMLSFSGSSTAMIGLKDLSVSGHENDNFTNSSVYAYYSNTGNKYNSGNLGSYGATYTTGDIIGVALDLDAGTLTFYKNGSSQGTAFSSLSGEYTIHLGTGLNAWVGVVNFGQDGTFAGNETAQGNTDDNGIGDFYYAPPSGHLALCSSNLPDTTISPNQSEQADDHFDTIIYDGSASNQVITTNFQADWLWFKERTTTGIDHNLFDSSRLHSSSSAKFGEKLESNTTDAGADSTAIVSQSTNDITLLGGVSTTNDTFSRTYVMWHWKANGGTTSSNTDGTITSTVQANTTSGFSIVLYTGTGSAGTIGHGLGVAPSMVITKIRNTANNWGVYHSGINDNTKALLLDTTGSATAYGGSTSMWNNTAPTSTVFSVGTNASTGGSGNFVAYVFAEVEGYSKFGSYTGNGSLDGTFIYTGFRPAWVMVKRTDSSGSWYIWDNARNLFNEAKTALYPNLTQIEGGTRGIDMLSNGFKIRTTAGDTNTSGATMIYMALAEQPFKFSNSR